MTDRNRDLRLLRLAVAMLCLFLAPSVDSRARDVSLARVAGERHVQFAIALGKEGVRLGSEEIAWIIEEIVDGCYVNAEDREALQGDDARHAQRYLEEVCEPWLDLWQPWAHCGYVMPPSWCSSKARTLERLRIWEYFDAFTEAIITNTDPKVRYKLIYLMIQVLYMTPGDFDMDAKDDLRDEQIDSWFAEAVGGYLQNAKSMDAVGIAKELGISFMGLSPQVAREFLVYGKHIKQPLLDESEAISRIVEEYKRKLVP